MNFSPLLSALFFLVLLPQGDADYYSPLGRVEAMSALVSDEIHYYGGFGAPSGSSGSVLGDFFYIDLTVQFVVSNQPYQFQSNLNPCGGASAIVYNNAIYIFGGYNTSGNTNNFLTIQTPSSSNPSVQIIQNTNSTAWPSARKWHTAVIDYVSVNMYIWGGTTALSPDSTQIDGAMYVFNIASNTWSSNPASNQPTGRQLHTATLLPDGRIIVIGGYYITDISQLVIYDTKTGQWSNELAAKFGTIPARCGHTATLLPDNKSIIVFGGYSQYENVAYYDLAILDTTNYTWRVVSSAGNRPTKSPYSHTAILYSNYIIFALGATADKQFINSVDILNISNGIYKWVDIYSPPAPPSPTSDPPSSTSYPSSSTSDSGSFKLSTDLIIGSVLGGILLLGIFCYFCCNGNRVGPGGESRGKPGGRPENLVDKVPTKYIF